MHKLNILLSGPNNFISTINELKQYLKFNLKYNDKKSLDISLINFDVLIFHHDSYEILKQKNDFKAGMGRFDLKTLTFGENGENLGFWRKS